VADSVVYVADIGSDIDDMIAVEFLHLSDALDYVVLDRNNIADKVRVSTLKKMGVKFKDEIQQGCRNVFVGGALTKVASYLNKGNQLGYLVIQGGFAGCNIVSNPLKKFKSKAEVRTFNLNIDVQSSLDVLDMTTQVKHALLLVSKNVCHSSINTEGALHNDTFLKKYKLSPKKRLHDLLAVKEGLAYMRKEVLHCQYDNVKLVCNGVDEYAKWSSKRTNDATGVLISTSLKGIKVMDNGSDNSN